MASIDEERSLLEVEESLIQVQPHCHCFFSVLGSKSLLTNSFFSRKK